MQCAHDAFIFSLCMCENCEHHTHFFNLIGESNQKPLPLSFHLFAFYQTWFYSLLTKREFVGVCEKLPRKKCIKKN